MVHRNQVARMLLAVRQAGVTDVNVLRAIEEIPRDAFAPEALVDQAYVNRTLPIGFGQTLSAPDVVAVMTQALAVTRTSRVLEVGTGSGYQAAVLSRIVQRLYSIERWPALAQTASNRLHQLGCLNVVTAHGDGYLGWPDHAPFDGIIVTAGASDIPQALLDQLAEGGRLVIPIGNRGKQDLVVVTKANNKLEKQQLGPVMFVPLLEGTE